MSVVGYSPQEQREQMQEWRFRMLWSRAYWLAPIAEVAREHGNTGGRPIEFSGDSRPIDVEAGGVR